MVSISLRAYVNEINDLVDEHQIDEAIAHSRHILEKFPKHVDTYRLLGKAYLEEQRYGDAADIMQRVLSSVPEDFIAQVGMSIIREDEGNLDSAIYHMERAFETQPSNHAIQSELRRLNSKRDGIELTRVRLTRGALARMYAHGHLYDQAISELMAALSENPNRFDLQILLAEMYYKTDKKVDAAETCTKILEKLPYCVNANKLLTQILEESGRPEEAKRYRQRWVALDPYAKFVGEEFPLIDTVPDNHVSLDHLVWDPSDFYADEDEQPAWATSLGLSIAGDEDAGSGEQIPDWLGGTAGDDLRPTEMLSSDAADPLFGEEPELVDGKRIGLIPQAEQAAEDQEDDWPSDFGGAAPAGEPGSEEAWLDTLDTTELGASAKQAEPGPFSAFTDEEEDDSDDWLASLETPSEELEPVRGEQLFEEDEAAEDQDDWLASLDTPVGEEEIKAVQEEDDTDDWLASLDLPPEEEEVEEDHFVGDDLEDDAAWLAALEAKTSAVLPTPEDTPSADPATELPDFLKEAGWKPGTGALDESAPVDLEDEEELAAAEIPDWIREMAPPEDEQEIEEDSEDLVAEADPEWMKSLEVPASSPADWLKELDKAELEEESASEPEPSTGDLATGQVLEADEAGMAWLENLAAKQGIPDEEMTISAERRAEVEEDDLQLDFGGPDLELPETLQPQPDEDQPEADTDWLKQLGHFEEEDQEVEPIEDAGDETSAWLDSIQQEETTKPEGESDDTISRFLAAKAVLGEYAAPEITDEEELAEDDWLAEPAGEAFDTDQETPQPVSPVDEEADDFDMDWLDAIGAEAAEEAAEDETLPEAPLAEIFEPISPVNEEADSFDSSWLDAIGAEAAEEAADLESAPAEEDWLEEVTEAVESEEEPDTDWLKQIGQEDQEETDDIPEGAAPMDGDADDFDEDWLAGIGAEAALEAEEVEAPVADTPALAAPVDEDGDDFDEDWLAGIGAEAALEAEEEAPPKPDSPVDEEADSFDTSWLDAIGAEAAEEAAQSEPGTVEDEWLTEVTETVESEDQEPSTDWLKQISQEDQEEPDDIPEVAPQVDEDGDDFDEDWLAGIGAEAALEAEEEPIAVEESPADDDWLTGLEAEPEDELREPASPVDEDEDDFDLDWLDEISTEAAGQAAAGEPVSPVDEELDDFDMDWLDEIGAEAAQEAAEQPRSHVEEAPAEDDWLAGLPAKPEEKAPLPISPVDEDQDQFDQGWLDEISAEAAQEAEGEADDDDWLVKIEEEDDLRQRDTIADTDAWLLSMEEESAGEEEQTEGEVADSDEWLTALGIEPEADQVEAESETPPVAELSREEPVKPTLADEWRPEPKVEPEAAPEPAPDPLAGLLETARQSMQANELGEALKSYAGIIKKGKMVEEVIQDLTEATSRHPINVKLWQTLGDAHLRIDHLQDALDAYSKAEDLLR